MRLSRVLVAPIAESHDSALLPGYTTGSLE